MTKPRLDGMGAEPRAISSPSPPDLCGMMRTNVATTKLVRDVLDDQLGEVFDDEGDLLFATEDLAGLDSDLSDELFLDIFEPLSDPERVLPDGRTLRRLAGEDLDRLVDHIDRALGGIAASAERHGLDFALQRGRRRSRRLGVLTLVENALVPDIVAEFLIRLDNPQHRHWGEAGKRYARLPAQPPEVADRRLLRALLPEAPEELSEEGAEFCIAPESATCPSRSGHGRLRMAGKGDRCQPLPWPDRDDRTGRGRSARCWVPP